MPVRKPPGLKVTLHAREHLTGGEHELTEFRMVGGRNMAGFGNADLTMLGWSAGLLPNPFAR